jgi:pyruvate formate lyase activating enzyme
MIRANIFDIKRFGITDGGGIRTVLFIKGCPMRCKWCHNPEGISHDIRLWRMPGRCVNCGSCIAACGKCALTADDKGILIDDKKCDLCGDCVRACPTGAMLPDAVSMSVEEAMREITLDRVFYGDTGGITLSGGECTASPEFSLAVLKACREKGIHTAIETCMYAAPEIMNEFAQNTDSIIADIKILDTQRHKEATGVDNALILNNFEQLARTKKDLLIRIPLIPGYTADAKNISDIAAYISSVNDEVPVELINFNPMCEGKYESLRRDFITGAPKSPFTRNQMKEFAQIVSDHGLQVKY